MESLEVKGPSREVGRCPGHLLDFTCQPNHRHTSDAQQTLLGSPVNECQMGRVHQIWPYPGVEKHPSVETQAGTPSLPVGSLTFQACPSLLSAAHSHSWVLVHRDLPLLSRPPGQHSVRARFHLECPWHWTSWRLWRLPQDC